MLSDTLKVIKSSISDKKAMMFPFEFCGNIPILREEGE